MWPLSLVATADSPGLWTAVSLIARSASLTFKDFMFIYVHVSGSGNGTCVQVSTEAKGTGSPEAGLRAGCELPDMGTRNQT